MTACLPSFGKEYWLLNNKDLDFKIYLLTTTQEDDFSWWWWGSLKRWRTRAKSSHMHQTMTHRTKRSDLQGACSSSETLPPWLNYQLICWCDKHKSMLACHVLTYSHTCTIPFGCLPTTSMLYIYIGRYPLSDRTLLESSKICFEK